MTPADRKPAERTLKEMLRAAEVVDDSPFVLPFKARQAIEIAVRRAAEVVRSEAKRKIGILPLYTKTEQAAIRRAAAELGRDAGLEER